jgi:hypothetical protein
VTVRSDEWSFTSVPTINIEKKRSISFLKKHALFVKKYKIISLIYPFQHHIGDGKMKKNFQYCGYTMILKKNLQ